MTELSISAELLAEDGVFSQGMPDFEFRPGQVAMATLVDQLINQSSTKVIEAGSGSGKTLSYLVPVLSRHQRVVISTASHFLQEQLCSKDIPLVKTILGTQQTVAVLKGRSNYLCPYFAEKRINQAGAIPTSLHSMAEKILTLYGGLSPKNNHNGDLSYLQCPPELSNFLSCSSEDCLDDLCPAYERCPLMQARKSANYADVVIINHSLLLAGQLDKLQAQDEPKSHRLTVVVDEAHRLMDFAQAPGSLRLSSRQLQVFFRECRRVVQQYAPEQLQVLKYLQRADGAVAVLYQQVPSSMDYHRAEHVAIVEQFLQGLVGLQRWFQAFLERDVALKNLAVRCANIVSKLQAILDAPGLCCVQSHGRSFVLQNIPVDTLEAVRRLINQHTDNPLLLTSATLSVGGSPDVFLSRMGLDQDCYSRIEEHHRYNQRACLYLPNKTVEPSDPSFQVVLDKQLRLFLEQVSGRVLVLFSSHRALQASAAQLALNNERGAERLLLVQGQQSSQQLISAFSQSSSAILLGTGSYWEGLDLSGAALSAVVIDKLPFASPTQPLVSLRSHYLQRHGVDAFREFLLPEAAMRLRQGCGRLLRRINEKGVIMLVDSRLTQRDYGEFFLTSLPQMPIIDSLDQVAHFLRS